MGFFRPTYVPIFFINIAVSRDVGALRLRAATIRVSRGCMRRQVVRGGLEAEGVCSLCLPRSSIGFASSPEFWALETARWL